MRKFYSITIKGCVFVMLFAGFKRGKAHYDIINQEGEEIERGIPENEVKRTCKRYVNKQKKIKSIWTAKEKILDEFLEYTSNTNSNPMELITYSEE